MGWLVVLKGDDKPTSERRLEDPDGWSNEPSGSGSGVARRRLGGQAPDILQRTGDKLPVPRVPSLRRTGEQGNEILRLFSNRLPRFRGTGVQGAFQLVLVQTDHR